MHYQKCTTNVNFILLSNDAAEETLVQVGLNVTQLTYMVSKYK